MKEDNCGKSGGRHALLFIPYFLVVANFGSHIHFHEAKALNCCTIVKKVSPFRKTSHVFNAENIYQFLHPNTNCLSCMLLDIVSTVFIPTVEFQIYVPVRSLSQTSQSKTLVHYAPETFKM